MLRVIVASAAVLALAGCSSSATSTSSSGTASGATPSASASLPFEVAPPKPGALHLVSKGLEKPGAQVILAAAEADKTVVASVLSQASPTDNDAGLVFSTDGGTTWKWGGLVTDPGMTFPEGIAATPEFAMMVGTNDQPAADGSSSTQAFIATAQAPDFVPKELALPAEFKGSNVHLQDVVTISGVWIVVGWEQSAPDANGKATRASFLWKSNDNGATWTKESVTVPGSSDNSLEELVFGVDGSWNLIGQAVFDQANGYDPLWLKSTDAGATFEVMNKKRLAGPLDQGATHLALAGDGSAAILGWSAADDAAKGGVSALWVSGPDQKLARVGGPEVPVSGGTPPGEFIDGILWNANALSAWGSPTGAYPMDNVQFWGLTKEGLTQSTMLPGNGTPIAVSEIIARPDDALAFGFQGKDLASADVAIWQGTSIQ